MRANCLIVHIAARHKGMCIAVYLALARSRSTRFIACVVMELTPQVVRGCNTNHQTLGKHWSVLEAWYSVFMYSSLYSSLYTTKLRTCPYTVWSYQNILNTKCFNIIQLLCMYMLCVCASPMTSKKHQSYVYTIYIYT